MIIPVGFGLARFIYRLSGDSEDMITTLGFKHSTGTTLADLDAALTALEADWRNYWGVAASMYTGWSYLGASATVNSSDAGVQQITEAQNVVGTAVGTTPPNNCAYLVKKLTGFGGRKGRGRFFLPPIILAEGNVDPAGNIAAAHVTVMQNSFNGMAGLFATHVGRPVLLHSNIADSPTDITGFLVDSKIATQRRRMRR